MIEILKLLYLVLWLGGPLYCVFEGARITWFDTGEEEDDE